MSRYAAPQTFRRSWLIVAGAAAFVLSIGLSSAMAAQPRIGVAAAVKNQVEADRGRVLAAGSEIFANELIRTGDASTAQFLFLDKTALSMGPKAQLRLDRFVYNPDRGSGQVVLDTVRGSFRFVTGAQNPNNYTIKTPTATLGIRGTVIDLLVQDGRTIVVLVEGAVKITLRNGQTLDLTRPGTAFVIGADGKVQGPLPWDGTIVNVVDGVPFPLYGWSFQGDPRELRDIFGNAIDRIDQLNAINARGFTPLPGPSTSPNDPENNLTVP